MDSLSHTWQKVLAERAASATLPSPSPSPTIDAPPAYTEKADDSTAFSWTTDDDDEDPEATTLTLNAGTTITGHDNIISTLSSPLADATRFSALLLAAVQKLNAKAEEEAAMSSAGRPRPSIKLNLIINAGLVVHGDRNVVGNVPVRRIATDGGKEGRRSGSIDTRESSPRKRKLEGSGDDDTDESKRSESKRAREA